MVGAVFEDEDEGKDTIMQDEGGEVSRPKRMSRRMSEARRKTERGDENKTSQP